MTATFSGIRCECMCRIAGDLYPSMFDTGSSITAGSFKLYNACQDLGIPMTMDTNSYSTVSGTIQGPKFRVELFVEVVGRKFPAIFVLFAKYSNPESVILGMDFMKTAKIVLEPYLDSWYFSDMSNRRYKYLTYAKCTETVDGEKPLIYNVITFQTMRANNVSIKNPGNMAKSKSATVARKRRQVRIASKIDVGMIPEISSSELNPNENKITWEDIITAFQPISSKEPCDQPLVSSKPLTQEEDGKRNNNNEEDEPPVAKKGKI